MRVTRVAIVEGEAAMRQLLVYYLREKPGLEVVGTAGNGLDGLRLCAEKKPDLLVFEIRLSRINGMEMLCRARALQPQQKALCFSGESDDDAIRSLLCCRPQGYVEKVSPLARFRLALQTVADGGSYFTPRAARLLPDALAEGSAPGEVRHERLTSREREVIQMVAEGMASKEIAATLGVALKTVDNHRTHLMEKLGLHNIAAITRYAVRRGIVPPY